MTQTTVVQSSRLSSLMFVLFCLGAVAIGFAPNVIEIGVSMAFVQWCFGLGAVAGVVGILFPSRLTLHPDRFEARSIFGTQGARWNDLEEVFCELRYIGWRVRRPDPDGLLQTLHRLATVDGRIRGRGWTLPQRELAALMEDYRRTAPADA